MADAYLWILAGQSNDQGTPGGPGPIPGGAGAYYVVPPVVATPARSLEWEDGGIGLVTLADNRPGTFVSSYKALPGSAWVKFMDGMCAATPEIHIAVRTARGGSSVLAANTNPTTGDWSTTGVRFADSISRTQDAMTDIAAAGHTLVGVNVIWHGGERDALIGADLGNFQATFTALLGRFRTALGIPTLKMYVARIGTTTAAAYGAAVVTRMGTVRGYQDMACAATPGLEMAYTDCVNFYSHGTPPLGWMRADNAHYQQVGYNDMGTQLATFIAADLGPPIPPPTRPSIRGGFFRLLRRGTASAAPPHANTIIDCAAAAVANAVATVAAPIPTGLAGDTVKLIGFSNNTAADYSTTSPTTTSDQLQAAIGCELLSYVDATTGGGTVTVTRSNTTAACIVVAVRIRDAGSVANAGFASASGDATAPDVNAAANGSLLVSVAVRLVSAAGQTWTIPPGMTLVEAGDTTGTILAWSVASLTVNTGPTGTKFWDQSSTGAVRSLNFVLNP